MTIIGKDPKTTIIDAQKQGRIFTIKSNGTLTLINITITNVYTLSDPTTSAIYNNGNLSVYNSIFTNNYAQDGAGGAILNTGSGNLYVSNSSFINNTVERSGGAIYTSGNSNIISSIFINNTVVNYTYSGAILASGGRLNVTNSVFLNSTKPPVSLIFGEAYADYNWWGDNNITEKYSGFKLSNYYIMNMSINNVTRYAAILIITYTLLDNETNTSIGTNLLPLFNAYLDYNGKIINISDGRKIQNITTYVNSFENNVTLNHNGIVIAEENFNVTKGDTNLEIDVSSNKSVGNTVTIKATLTNQNGKLLSGKT